VHLVQGHVRTAGDVEEEAARTFDADVQERAAQGLLGRDRGPVVAIGLADGHQARAPARHHRAHIRKVKVDQPRDGDQLGDALDALAQRVVGQCEGLLDAGPVVGQLEEPVIGDDDQGVHALPQPREAFLGHAPPPGALEGERPGDDAHRQDAHFPGQPGDHRRRARARAAAHAAGHEQEVGVSEQGPDIIAGFPGCHLTDLRVAARAEPPGQLLADVEPAWSVGLHQRLGIGVDGDELDPPDAQLDHPVDDV